MNYGTSQQLAAEAIVDQMIEKGVGGLAVAETTPTISIVTCTTANTEATGVITNSRLLILTARSNAIRYSFTPNKAATSIEPYRTLPANATRVISLAPGTRWTGTIYVASSTANSILEIESWS